MVVVDDVVWGACCCCCCGWMSSSMISCWSTVDVEEAGEACLPYHMFFGWCWVKLCGRLDSELVL